MCALASLHVRRVCARMRWNTPYLAHITARGHACARECLFSIIVHVMTGPKSEQARACLRAVLIGHHNVRACVCAACTCVWVWV